MRVRDLAAVVIGACLVLTVWTASEAVWAATGANIAITGAMALVWVRERTRSPW